MLIKHFGDPQSVFNVTKSDPLSCELPIEFTTQTKNLDFNSGIKIKPLYSLIIVDHRGSSFSGACCIF